jgi:hypothetical protein
MGGASYLLDKGPGVDVVMLWLVAFVSLGYILLDRIVPLMIFRGRNGRAEATAAAKSVSLSGCSIARAKIAPTAPFQRGFHAIATLYPLGICFKQPFLAPYALLLADIASMERKTRWVTEEVKVTHSSPHVQSPLLIITRRSKTADEFFDQLARLRKSCEEPKA